MALIKKMGFFGAPLLIMAGGALSAQGCDPGDVCGPCGEIENGATGISGSAKLDGFFKAVSLLNAGAATANAQFEGGLANLEAAFGLEATGSLDARVDALCAQIETDISANVEGGLTVDYQPAKCEANIDVSVEAQANCEVEAGCSADVKCDPGEVSVTCEGSCTGSCTGGCSGDLSCTVSVEGGAACEGTCEGSCELEAAATCEGTCRGECSGTCSATDANGQCAGSCSGDCQGTCELKAGASCSGTCHGKCTASVEAEADCTGSVKCEAECTGECSGGCEGTAKAPSCEGQASCDARADCEASASAQASASVECSPPSLAIDFALAADAEAQAEFTAKMAALQLNAGTMLTSSARFSSLFEGDACAAAEISSSLNAVISAGVEGELFLDVPSGKLPCVMPALEESVTILGELTSEAAASLSAQAKFAAAISSGFSG
jgi:modification target Cys-rich repeat protein